MLIVFTAIHVSLGSCFKEELMDTALLLTGVLLTLYLLTGDTSVPTCLYVCCFLRSRTLFVSDLPVMFCKSQIIFILPTLLFPCLIGSV